MQIRYLNKKYILLVIAVLFVLIFSITLKAYATPPATPYTPGETLNPTCGPTDTNCTVSITGSSGWGLSGNAGTTSSNFIGTIDDHPLIFKMNNEQAGRIDTNNTFLGSYVSNSTMTGGYNTAIGSGSFGSNTTGYQNTAIGYAALVSNTTGIGNTANGYLALYSNTGSYNVALGQNSLYFNTNGGQNTAIGSEALYRNIIGENNIAIGSGSGFYETGNSNLYIGKGGTNEAEGRLKSLIYGKFDASTANQFVNINGTLGILDSTGAFYTKFTGGAQSGDITYTLPTAQGGVSTVLTNNGSGSLSWESAGSGSGWGLTGNGSTNPATNFIGTTDNEPLIFKVNNNLAGKIDNTTGDLFLGYQAGSLAATTGNNVGIGTQALNNIGGGLDNVAIGTKALYSNNDGVRNIAIGTESLYSNAIGGENVAIGFDSMHSKNEGLDNTAVGTSSLFSNVSGGGNVALGFGAGSYETTSDNLYIDNQIRDSEVDGRIKALIYGKFDADPVNQQLFFNAQKINMKYLPTSSTGLDQGDLWNNNGVVNVVEPPN